MCHSAFFPYVSSAVRDSLWQRLSVTARLAIKSHHSALCLISLSSKEKLQQLWTHESFGKQVFAFEGLHLSSHQSSYILVLVVGVEVRSCRFHIPEFSFRNTKVQTTDGRNHLLIQPISWLCTFVLLQLQIFAFTGSYISFLRQASGQMLLDEVISRSLQVCSSVWSWVQTRTYACDISQVDKRDNILSSCFHRLILLKQWTEVRDPDTDIQERVSF